MTTTLNIQDVTTSMVRSVYSGKKGCCCGCKGRHWYHPATRDEASKDRGYVVRDKELSVAQVTKVLRTVQAHEDLLMNDEVGIYSVEVGSRLYVVYLSSAGLDAVSADEG